MRPYQHCTDARRPLKPALRKTSLSGFYETEPDEQEMIMAHTLKSLFAKHPDNAPAIGAPGREWMTYGELKSLSQDVRKILRSAGIGATERVAIVLPNGPEMAAAFVTVAQSATTAPLNPAYKEEEFAFYLEDLKACSPRRCARDPKSGVLRPASQLQRSGTVTPAVGPQTAARAKLTNAD